MTGVNINAMRELAAIREDPSKGGILLNEAIREIDESRGNAASWQRLARELEEMRDQARAERDHYRAALEATRDALADANAMTEAIDSPANRAFAIINHALAALPRGSS